MIKEIQLIEDIQGFFILLLGTEDQEALIDIKEIEDQDQDLMIEETIEIIETEEEITEIIDIERNVYYV